MRFTTSPARWDIARDSCAQLARPDLVAAIDTYGTEVESDSGELWTVTLPAVAWRDMTACVGKMLYDLRRWHSRSTSWHAANGLVKRLARHVVAIENHPALRNEMAAGRQEAWLPAWSHDGRWSPYPQPDTDMWVLQPVVAEVGFDRIAATRWEPLRAEQARHLTVNLVPPVAPLLEEAFHRGFDVTHR